jgi:hypothetical protein
MKEFVLIFRSSQNPHANPTPAQMKERMGWMEGVLAQNKVADKGNRLSAGQAKTIQSGNRVAEGPFKETGDFINGYMIVKVATIDEAIQLAKTNPILQMGGNIEVRAVLSPGEKDVD